MFKKHRIQTAHRPIQTIASTLHTKKKDRINDLDKAGIVYYHKCKTCGEDYVGETGRCWRERMHDHRLLSHKEAKTSHTFTHKPTESAQPEPPQPIPTRRSARINNQAPINYKTMNAGENQYTNEGESPIAQHVTLEHNKEEIESKILSSEGSYTRRGIKEALSIQEFDPSLNRDDGRYQLSLIYTTIPKYAKRSSKTVKKDSNITGDSTQENRSGASNEAGSPTQQL